MVECAKNCSVYKVCEHRLPRLGALEKFPRKVLQKVKHSLVMFTIGNEVCVCVCVLSANKRQNGKKPR